MTDLTAQETKIRMLALANIPKEMFYAFELLRLSGLYNMSICIHPGIEDNRHEFTEVMSKLYMEILTRVDVDLENNVYPKLTFTHAQGIAARYSYLRDIYGDVPEELKKLIPRKTTSIVIGG